MPKGSTRESLQMSKKRGGAKIMDNKEFNEIMNEITNGLIGDMKTDFNYLQEQMEKYKEYGGCGVLLRNFRRIHR